MQFKVPQFIDVEDKLFGPLTFRQFVYLAGGAGGIYVIYKILPLWLAFIPIALVAGVAIMLTFFKVNGKPFIHYLQAGFSYFTSSKLYLWKQRIPKATNIDREEKLNSENQLTSIVPTMSSSKLKDLSWSLDVEEKQPDN